MPPAFGLQQLFCDPFVFAHFFQFPVNFFCRQFGLSSLAALFQHLPPSLLTNRAFLNSS
jgi:hypothetical protein